MGKKKKVEQDGADRVCQGGSLYDPPADGRVALRGRFEPGYRSAPLGVRLVRRRSALEWLADALREVDDGQEEG